MYGSCMVQVQFKYSPYTVHIQSIYRSNKVLVQFNPFAVHLWLMILAYSTQREAEDAEHLLRTIQDRHPVKADWDPRFYLGVTLEFDYEEQTCKMLM